MIRLPPASISLSNEDIGYHLQEIEIYRGLLKQGFRKKDVREFLERRREDGWNSIGSQRLEMPIRAPAWVDLVSRGLRREATHFNSSDRLSSGEKDESKIRAASLQEFVAKKKASSVERRSEDFPSQRRFLDLASSGQHAIPTSSTLSSTVHIQAPSPSAARTVSSESMVHHHVPRQSSLLRFSRNISPDEHEGRYSYLDLPLSPTPLLERGPETGTHTDDRSETGSGASSSPLNNVFQQLLLDDNLVPNRTLTAKRSRLRGDAAEFTPSELPKRFPDAAREHVLRVEGSAARRQSSNWHTSPSANPRIVPLLQSERLSDPRSARVDRSSSSPLVLLNVSLGDTLPLPPTSPVLPSMPPTPVRAHRPHDARTEPRYRRHQYLDGNSFVPYDDYLPADVQPQTPADLFRQRQADELTATYTAPPGRPRQAHVASLNILAHNLEPGEPSPTFRAISIRQRRNRESARSTRVEGLRITRTRRRLRTSRDDRAGTLIELDDPWFEPDHNQVWRDGLDADRVGDENFEDVEQSPDMTDAAVRVVSGNRRPPAV